MVILFSLRVKVGVGDKVRSPRFPEGGDDRSSVRFWVWVSPERPGWLIPVSCIGRFGGTCSLDGVLGPQGYLGVYPKISRG